jgi:hypothetical protein
MLHIHKLTDKTYNVTVLFVVLAGSETLSYTAGKDAD